MRKFLALICIVFTFTFLTSCSGIQQKVSYDYNEYEIQTWNNWYNYNATISTNNINHLDSLKKVEIVRAEKSIQKLRKLNSNWF